MARIIFQMDGRLAVLAKMAKYEVEKLAVLYGRSSRQLRRDFQEHFGCAPTELFNALKQAEARKALLARKPLKQIASELGYGHVPNFCNWFKEHTGLRPTEFINGQTDTGKASQNVRFS